MQLGLGLLGTGAAGLLVGDVLGRAAGVGTLMRSATGAIRSAGVTAHSMLSTAVEHRGFAGWMATAALLSTAAFHAPFLLVPANFGAAAAGTYFLAYRILVVPVTLIGSGAGQVFFGEAAQVRKDPERLRELAAQVAVALLAVGWPIYGGLLVAGRPLFAVAFGPEWSDAGSFAQLLAPSFLLWSIASPLSSMLVVGRREAESVVFASVEMAARIGAIAVGAAAGSILAAVLLLAVVGVALNSAAIWRFLRPARVSLRSLLMPTAAIAAINMPGLALLALLSSGTPAWWLVLLYAAVVLVGIMAALALLAPVRRLIWRPA
jgi:O-antigen/teichoic acid export membrane protein